MKKIVRLTENDLVRLVNKVLMEQNDIESPNIIKIYSDVQQTKLLSTIEIKNSGGGIGAPGGIPDIKSFQARVSGEKSNRGTLRLNCKKQPPTFDYYAWDPRGSITFTGYNNDAAKKFCSSH